MVQAAHQRRDVDGRVLEREPLRAAELVAVIGVVRAGAGDRVLGDLDAERVRSGAGQRAHERAVAAADVDDGLAAQVDRVRQLLEVAHERQRTLKVMIKPGWTGRFFEDFEVGDVYEHPLGRTVLPVDNSWFTLLTQNTADLHFDAHYAAQTEWGRPLVDSTFTLALVTGQSVTDVSQNVMANLGWDEVRLPAPVFEGDTIYSDSEVLEVRDSKSRENVGIVTVAHARATTRTA